MDRGRGRFRRGGGNHGGGRHYTPRGRSQRSAGTWTARGGAGAGAHPDEASSGSGSSEVESRSSEVASVDGVTKKVDTLTSENPSGHSSESLVSLSVSPNDGNLKVIVQNVPGTEPKSLNAPSTGPCYGIPFPSLSTNSELDVVRTGMCSQSRDQGVENRSSADIISTPLQTVGGQISQKAQSGKTSSEGTSGKAKLDKADSQDNGASFDICNERDGKVPMLKKPLHIQILRPGMILLKGYLSLTDQVKLVKSCRNLGRGPGGFYQPGYRDGAKLFLKMMCLGKNWDPQTGKYDDTRPTDQAKAPPIPDEFQRLVKEAIQKCYHYLESDCEVMDPSKLLPPMSPNICIINFYSSSGKLGLHQR